MRVLHINRYHYIAALLGVLLVLATSLIATAASDVNAFVRIEGSTAFHSVLQASQPVQIKSFWLQQHPVTNAEYLVFVKAHPQWRRDNVAAVFAGHGYLAHWQSSTETGPGASAQHPVTQVSWFAAQAYCESIDARLPTWYEWELVAAASETAKDARNDAAWRQRILDWYAKPGNTALDNVMQNPANNYGVHDMHGLIWEWVLDFNSLIDSTQTQNLCGGGALTLQQKENFAILMHVAMLSSLHGSDTTRTLGFRCARDMSP
ncbi:MAG TPA: formylglycine-generating enzyme family protein [Steroidobacteraceae bacterium]|nr:formylglycine-generating enzyme family protein [Steroidobacteraceae bacterium]